MWNDIFLTIASSGINDSRFSSLNFSLCTTKEVERVMRFLDRKERIRTNAASVSTAKLALVVIQALSDRKNSAALPKLDDFLPFSVKDLQEEQEATMTASTAIVVKRLMKTGRLPIRIVAAMADELKKFASQQD